ncbi:MAG: GDP-mannose 4,6-dehydratase [Candidatus Zixiibacteriota bacterium]|nr:MAG: GDP-mannose 4,6-dehydratase [candidate division Zixibacteria bacterium]
MKKKSRALITGIAGFVGSHLAELLLAEEFEVFGFLAPGETKDNIRHISGGINLERFDIRKEDKVAAFVAKVKPDYLFHLAAFSSVGRSFANERLTYEINFTGALNVFEAAAGLGGSLKKIIFTSSADAYGAFKPTGKRLAEEQTFNPISPYGVSKAAGEYLARCYVRNHRLQAVIARAFNHTGPRQSVAFVVPSFCRQIATIEKRRKKPEISVGDLSAKRDLSDVRDIVYGYYLMALKGVPGEAYQLCSGQSVTIRTVLEKLLKMSSAKIKTIVDKNRFRKSDIPVLKGDNLKAKMELGWFRRYSLNETLKDTLEYWRASINTQARKVTK